MIIHTDGRPQRTSKPRNARGQQASRGSQHGRIPLDVDDDELGPDSEVALRKRRIRFILALKDAELNREAAEDRKRGYCPQCHLLLPITGRCDCGYIKPTKKVRR